MKAITIIFIELISFISFSQVTEYHGDELYKTHENLRVLITVDKSNNKISINNYYTYNTSPIIEYYDLLSDEGISTGYNKYSVRHEKFKHTVYTLLVKRGAYSLYQRDFKYLIDYRGNIDFEIKT